jgi:peptidoglycan/LPS O-acetylase OafA/YrhL
MTAATPSIPTKTAYMPRVSLDDKFRDAQYHPSGFDYQRILLSMAIVAVHSIDVCYGEDIALKVWDTPLVGFLKLAMPMFFILSGFLITGSLERCRTLVSFLGLRALRIYPALIVEVVLSALLIGPLVTNVPLLTYFSDPKFFHYLVNITGYISYELPGVFTTNPTPDIVNMQLWAIPWELIGYGTGVALIFMGIKKHRWVVLIAVAIWLMIDVALLYREGELAATLGVYHDVHSGGKLIVLFLLGTLAFYYRAFIPYNALLFWASLAFSVFASYALPAADYLTMIPLVYLTLFLGVTDFKRVKFIGLADYSYGIYLYGWIFQQFLVDVFPWSRHWYINIALSLPLAIIAGMISWYGVEKPAKSLKPYLWAIEEKWISLKARLFKTSAAADS